MWECREGEAWNVGHTFFSRLLLADSSLSTSSSYSVLILCRSVSSSRRVSQYFSSMAGEDKHKKSHPESHTYLLLLPPPFFFPTPFYSSPPSFLPPLLPLCLSPLLLPSPHSPFLPTLLPSLLSPSPSSDCLIRAKMLISASCKCSCSFSRFSSASLACRDVRRYSTTPHK